jgi:hypothetical protein
MITLQIQALVAGCCVICRDWSDGFTPKGEYGGENSSAPRPPDRFHALLFAVDLDFQHDRVGIEDGLFRFLWINVMASHVANVGLIPIKCRLLHSFIVTTLSIQLWWSMNLSEGIYCGNPRPEEFVVLTSDKPALCHPLKGPPRRALLDYGQATAGGKGKLEGHAAITFLSPPNLRNAFLCSGYLPVRSTTVTSRSASGARIEQL